MNFFSVALVFVGIPLLVILGLAAVTIAPSRNKARPKYTPGSSWDYSPRFYTGDTPVDVPAHLADASLGGARGSW